MKKTLIILITVLMFILTGCGSVDQNNSAQTNEENVNEPSYEPITDAEIKDELQFIQEVLQVNKSKEEIEKAFDERYHKYIIPRESLDAADTRGLNDVHFYIYSNKNRLLSFEVGENFNDGSTVITEVKENSIVTPAYEYPVDAFFLNMDLFVSDLLLTRKSGIKIEILYSDVDLVLRANVFYVNEENKVNTISYYNDGTITLYENVTKEEHYRSF